MTPKNIELLRILFGQVGLAPALDLHIAEEQHINIADGLLTISPAEVEEEGVLGVRRVPAFVLKAKSYNPADPDAELYTDTSFTNVAVRAVGAFVETRAMQSLEQEENFLLARDADNAAELDQMAYREGRQDYQDGLGEGANPYQVDHSYFYAWRKGWQEAQRQDSEGNGHGEPILLSTPTETS